MSSQAYQQFEELVGYVDQLIAVHGKLQQGKGRRHRQDAIHRAGVVMMVAAWQGYIEAIVRESYDAIEAAAGTTEDAAKSGDAPVWARQVFALRRNDIEIRIKKFNTPNSTFVRDILKDTLGFTPWPIWEWRSRRRQWSQQEMKMRMDTWVNIRHSVAHGYALPNNVEWLKNSSGSPRLTLLLLKECRRYFKYVVEHTDDAVASHLHTYNGIVKPW
jgi:hypothetical protein